MTEELINMDGIGNALVYIADKIGITVAQMYEIYVKAQAMMALLQIVMILAIIGISISVFLICYFYAINKIFSDIKSDSDRFLASAFIAFIAFIASGFIMAMLYTPLLAYLCPEYTALKSLMGDIGNIASILRG